jgi:dihydroorotate dehydrogenase (NAD+) catalytic subunit
MQGKNNSGRPYQLYISTEDGSLGNKGLITDILERYQDADFFINCGPREMVNEAIKIESQIAAPERIYSSIDHMTRCGVGLCGSCADEHGLRTCIEGPFMKHVREER